VPSYGTPTFARKFNPGFRINLHNRPASPWIFPRASAYTSGGIRADVEAGEVTYGELFTVQPFENGLVTMELTGEQIYALLEQQFRADGSATILQVSGLEYTYNAANPVGSKIVSVTLPDGSSLDPTATYTVAVNGFLATGGDGFTVFEEGQNVQTVGGDLEALVAYIQNLDQPFNAPDPFTEPRITIG
jgi:5'-nucleotidase